MLLVEVYFKVKDYNGVEKIGYEIEEIEKEFVEV